MENVNENKLSTFPIKLIAINHINMVNNIFFINLINYTIPLTELPCIQ